MRHGNRTLDICARIEYREERLRMGLTHDTPDDSDINSSEQQEIEAARLMHAHIESHPLGTWCHKCEARHWVQVVGIEPADTKGESQ